MRSVTAPTPRSDAGPTSLLVDAVRGWDRFWFSPLDPTTLCFIRLCTGLVVFYVHLTYSWGLLSYIGPEAWIDKDSADYIIRKAPVYGLGLSWDDPLKVDPTQKGNYYWSIYFHVTEPGWIVALHVGFLAVMLMFALGLWTRYTAALTWAGAMCYVQRASSTVFGLDTMMMIVLLYLMIGPSGAVLSLDRWLEKRRARLEGRGARRREAVGVGEFRHPAHPGPLLPDLLRRRHVQAAGLDVVERHGVEPGDAQPRIRADGLPARTITH